MRNASRPNGLPCRYCGEPTWSKSPSKDGTVSHAACRPVEHGTVGAYSKRKCRCIECRSAHAARQRDYDRMVKEREGVSPTQKYRPARRCVRCGEKVGGGPVDLERCPTCRPPAGNGKRARRRRRDRVERKIRKAAAGTAPHIDWPWVSGQCGECGEAFTRKGEASPYCSTACSRKERRRRRRARKTDAFVERVYRNRIMERDGWRCQLCGKAVNRKAKIPHPKAPVIDHIIPLAAGGTHEPANAQCAHFLCNSLKRDQAANDQLRLIG